MGDIQILIPSLNPDGKLLNVVNSILENTDYPVILVDDGSSEENRVIFDTAVQNPRCTLLRHAVNLGKGRALKTGFNHILNNFPDSLGVITVDGDGQHATEDIIHCADVLKAKGNCLVLGSRNFDMANVPKKSEFGNKITRNSMKILCGINIPDTQTGLRGISREFMEILMNTPGERFEFETNMLLCAKENNIPFEIVPIQTVYIEENKSSHFNPIKDSIRIYSIFLKFILASSTSFLIDIGIFTLLVMLLRDLMPLYYIFVSTAVARVFSAVYNFNVNKYTVFKNKNKFGTTEVKYFFLCAVQAVISSMGVKWLFLLLNINETIIKIIVDMILFFISFGIQRDWVFKNHQK